MWPRKNGSRWTALDRRGDEPPAGPELERESNGMKQLLLRIWRDERGQDLVEYALIVAAVGLALITTVNTLSQAVVSLYESITAGLASIGASGQ